jgi:cyclophilin family peptidyl-prolyl cis-trans isomerase
MRYTKVLLIVASIFLLTGCSQSMKSKAETFVKDYDNKPMAVVFVETGEEQLRLAFALNRAGVDQSFQQFVYMAEQGLYQNMKFHRADNQFVGAGDPRFESKIASEIDPIPLEIHPEKTHQATGTLSLSKEGNGESSGSEFFITRNVEDPSNLDGKYAILGELIHEDESALDSITTDSVIVDVVILK